MEIEMAVIRELERGDQVANAAGLEQTALARVLDQLGFNKMCCRSNIMNSTMYFIRTTDLYRSRIEQRIIRPIESTIEKVAVPHTPLIIYAQTPPAYPLLPGEVAAIATRNPQIPEAGLIPTIGLDLQI
jgi:DNA-directed RNA polymerase subunit N (RpoN/RPB10)